MSEQLGLSDESQRLRLGRFPGSEIHKLMGTKGFGKTGETFIFEKATEFDIKQKCTPRGWTSDAVKWGQEYEPHAKLHYEKVTSIKLETCKTIIDDEMCGTPDGVASVSLGLRLGIEIKCPYNSANHTKNLLINSTEEFKEIRSEYYWQCVTYMLLLGYDNWHFVSYDPRREGAKVMSILNIKPLDDDLNLLLYRVRYANQLYDDIVQKLNKFNDL